MTENCQIDASGIEYLVPAGLVQLALLLRHIARQAAVVQFVAPVSAEVDSFLHRMGFYAHVPNEVDVFSTKDQDASWTENRSDVLVPLRQFNTPTEFEELSEELLPFIRRHNLPAPFTRVIWDVVAELCGNAASHSGSLHGAFIAAQKYPVDGLGHIAVADLGIGIRDHLANNPRYSGIASDLEAIEEAIKPGVTGTRDARGWGFEEVQMQAGLAHHAELLIQSGHGRAQISVVGQSRTPIFATTPEAFPGTLVQLILRND